MSMKQHKQFSRCNVESSHAGDRHSTASAHSKIERGQKAASPTAMAGWERKSFNDCFATLSTRGHQIQTKQYLPSGHYPVVDQGETQFVGFCNDESKVLRCPKEGVIVFGDHTRNVKFIDEDFVVGADGTKLLVSKDSSTEFLFNLLLNTRIPNTGYNRHFKFLQGLSFPIPPISTQRRIIAILSASDRVIEGKQKLLDSKKQQKRALMRMLMEPEGGDAAFSRVGRTRPEGRITRKMRPLGSFLDFKNGINAPKEQFGSGIKLISVREVLDELPICYNSIRASVDVPEKTIKAYSVEFGDILIQRSSENAQEAGSCNVYLDTKPAVFGSFVIRGKKKADYNPVFFKSLLQSQFVRRQIVGRAAGAQHFNVGQEELESIIIPVFRKEEQDRIATIFTAADREIDGLAREINAWKEKRKALSQLLLSGKVRV